MQIGIKKVTMHCELKIDQRDPRLYIPNRSLKIISVKALAPFTGMAVTQVADYLSKTDYCFFFFESGFQLFISYWYRIAQNAKTYSFSEIVTQGPKAF